MAAEDYKINYLEANGASILEQYNGVACFSKIFSNGIEKETTDIYLYIPHDHLNITLDQFKVWVSAVNNAGFPCEYMGNSSDEELRFLALEHGQYVVKLHALKYSNVVHLSAGLTYVRYAYDYSGHCGSNPHTICLNYFAIKDKYKVDDLSAIIGASALYGTGGHHIVHNKPNLTLYTIKQYIAACTVDSLYKGHRQGLWDTSNNFAKGIKYNNIDSLSALYSKKLVELKTKVYVVGGDIGYANWLPNSIVCKTLKQADVVLFTGGEDVSPCYYKQPTNPRTYSNRERDVYEKGIFTRAKKMGKKMLGICRGSQFLCVMNGGQLVQHQQNPNYIHTIELLDGTEISITSTHHQAQYPFNLKKWEYKVLGWTKGLSAYHQDGLCKELNPPVECEIVYYPNTQSLGIQGHPEFRDYQEDYPASLAKLKELFLQFVNKPESL